MYFQIEPTILKTYRKIRHNINNKVKYKLNVSVKTNKHWSYVHSINNNMLCCLLSMCGKIKATSGKRNLIIMNQIGFLFKSNNFLLPSPVILALDWVRRQLLCGISNNNGCNIHSLYWRLIINTRFNTKNGLTGAPRAGRPTGPSIITCSCYLHHQPYSATTLPGKLCKNLHLHFTLVKCNITPLTPVLTTMLN